jgi:hypothetical protein
MLTPRKSAFLAHRVRLQTKLQTNCATQDSTGHHKNPLPGGFLLLRPKAPELTLADEGTGEEST